MAEKKFSELPSAASLTGNELAALSQMQSGSLASVKSTLQAIANWFAVYAQYTTALQTTDKSIAGAINELKRQIALIPGFDIVKVNSLPTEDIDTHTLYLVPSQDPEAQNSCDEYINTDGTTAGWELIGSTDIDLSDYYTKLEVDGLLEDKLEADDFEANQTASANPITLETKQAGLAKSCVVEMNPIQDLHGYSSPWAGGAGKNKIDVADYIGQTGTTFTFAILNDFVGKTLTLSADVKAYGSGGTTRVRLQYNLNGETIYSTNTNIVEGKSIATLEIPENATDVQARGQRNGSATSYDVKNIMLEIGSTAHDYEPYENICPISGRTQVKVDRCGKNLFDNTATESGYINSTGNVVSPAAPWLHEFIKIIGGLTYTISGCNENTSVYHVWYDKNMNFISNFSRHANGTFTAPNNAGYMGICAIEMANASHDLDTIQVEIGNQATTYSAYQGQQIIIQFGQTVYGALLDAQSGNMTITKKAQRFGDMEWTYHSAGGVYSAYFDAYLPNDSITGQGYVSADIITERYKSVPSANIATTGYDNGVMALASNTRRFIVCDQNFTDATTFKTTLADVIVVYPLAEQIEIQLSPEAITLLKGLNVISTDGDKVRVEFSDIPVGDYSVLLGYIKSLEARIAAVEP